MSEVRLGLFQTADIGKNRNPLTSRGSHKPIFGFFFLNRPFFLCRKKIKKLQSANFNNKDRRR